MDIEEWLSSSTRTLIGKYVRWVRYHMGIWTRYTQFRLYHEYVLSAIILIPVSILHLQIQSYLPHQMILALTRQSPLASLDSLG